jgi:hypothetical protein
MSSGVPSQKEICNDLECVIDYATAFRGIKLENIIL